MTVTITKLTPEQARALGAALARALGYVRQILDQIRALARAVVEAARQFAEMLRRSPLPAAAAAARSRPAWMSPYGPPARRHRR
ncbi:hypothetical protein [Streptomyces variegatus]|uniref:hypothetical protein n=1 Tax=Streptomyces variegatus TaxID=284040 RepID=UPI003C2B3ABE